MITLTMHYRKHNYRLTIINVQLIINKLTKGTV